VQAVGIDVRRWPGAHPEYRRAKLIRHRRVTHVFDVGASDGRYGEELRRFGYGGDIVSFEPLADSYAALSARAADDPRWHALRHALGRTSGTVTINVAGNAGASSSILPMLDRHVEVTPEAGYTRGEEVEQRTLDELWRLFAGPSDRIFLKLDVQGYEREVLAGAEDLLGHCLGLQLELSLVPLYEGSMLYRDAFALAEGLGFELASLEAGFTDPRIGQTLQADAVFFRRR
jgi:FkbM family methyltransferase